MRLCNTKVFSLVRKTMGKYKSMVIILVAVYRVSQNQEKQCTLIPVLIISNMDKCQTLF